MNQNIQEIIRGARIGQYMRKSSEAEDKQVQSNEDQARELEQHARRDGLNIIKRYPGESRSAFEPGRPIFNEFVTDIQNDVINAAHVWHPNRLSRNPVDAGMIIYLMDIGKLLFVVTPSRIYFNTPNDKFLLQLELSISKKDSDEKGENVKRGLRGKALKGYPTGMAKIGYINDKSEEKGNRKWLRDGLRFPLVKQIFQMFLSGKYSVSKLHKIARDEMKLTTPQRKKEGGKPIAISYFYTMLADPIFAGFFFYEGQRRELNPVLERMITEEEYWKIQSMLGQKGRPRGRSEAREGLYNYFMRDQNDGCVTPDFKFQVICDCKCKFSYLKKSRCPKCEKSLDEINNPKYLSYIFYYSTKEKRDRTIKARGVEEKKIDQQILEYFSNEVAISEELSTWCIKYIGELKDEEINNTLAISKSHQEAEFGIRNKLSRLLDLRLSRDNITVEETKIFDEKEADLKKELEQIKNLQKNPSQDKDWLQNLEKKFNLMAEILEILKNGNRRERKEILMEFGSNLTLSDGKVSICHVKEIQLFLDCLKECKTINPQFEPKITLADKDETEVFASVCPTLLPRQDSNLRPIA